MNFHDSKVLVTGGAGFIGANLADRLLKEGAQVTVLDDFSVGSMWNLERISGEVTIVKGDVRNVSNVEKVVPEQDLIFHLAANASVPISSEDPRYDFEVNALGTLNVLEALRSSDSSAPLVFASSAAVYGEYQLEPPSEENQLTPVSPYGASKLAGEIVCQTFMHTYGLSTMCLRLCNVYGPLQRKYVMFDILQKLRKRRSTLEVLGTGNEARDFIYISDALDACLMLAQAPLSYGQVYNVGTGVGTTIRELVNLILEVLGLEHKTEVRYTSSSWKGDVRNLLVDVTKIRKLGFLPKVDLKTGLRQFVNWYSSSYPYE